MFSLSYFLNVYMMLIHKIHAFEPWIETRFEVCEPCSFFDTTYVVTNPIQAWIFLAFPITT